MANDTAPESFGPDDLAISSYHTRLVGVRIGHARRWTVVFAVDFRFTLPDGRELEFRDEMRLGGIQIGRKPRRKRKGVKS